MQLRNLVFCFCRTHTLGDRKNREETAPPPPVESWMLPHGRGRENSRKKRTAGARAARPSLYRGEGGGGKLSCRRVYIYMRAPGSCGPLLCCVTLCGLCGPHILSLKVFVIGNHNEFFETSCIFRKLSSRAFQKHIVLYIFEVWVKSYSKKMIIIINIWWILNVILMFFIFFMIFDGFH